MLEAATLGVLVAAGVVGPLAVHGWLLVLDWVHGPNAALPAGYWGFGFPPGPLPALVDALAAVVGGPAASWVVIALCFPVAAAGAARLVPGGRLAGAAAGLLYAVNPFVFERLGAGQVFVLASYALLPYFVRSVLRAEGRRGLARLAPALWLAALVAPSVNFAWIGGLVLLAVVAWRHRAATVRWGLEVVAVAAVLDAYLLVPALAGGRAVTGVAGGAADLAAYQTSGDHQWGLFVNVAGLYGFWRQGYLTPPKAHLSGWPVLVLVILVVAVIGLVQAWRGGARTLVGTLGLAAVAAYLLALGAQGPTGAAFRLLYDHLPGFDVLREPEKFVSVVGLVYAVGFGLGAERLVAGLARPATRRTMAAVLLVVPLAYTPTIFDGLGGQLRTSAYPASWAAANRLMGTGPGQILFLPWHEYLAFPFTHGQVIANPASQVFSRPVISGDDVEIGAVSASAGSQRSAYLEALFARGPQLDELGHLVAQLGVRYVVLASTADAASYGWLHHQRDLVEVFDRGGLQVWRNAVALPEGARLTASLTVRSVGEYITLAQREDLVGTAVFVDPRRPPAGRPTPRDDQRRAPPPRHWPAPVADVTRLSRTAYRVAPGPPGWAVLPVDFDRSWSLHGRAARPLADGVVALAAGPTAATTGFSTWEATVVGDVVSAAALVGLGTGMVVAGRRRPRRPAGADGVEAADAD